MAKSRSRKRGVSNEARTTSSSGAEVQTRNYDPALISLFAQSSGAVKPDARTNRWSASHPTTTSAAEASRSSSDAHAEENGLPSKTSIGNVHSDASDTGYPNASIFGNHTSQHSSRKRKRQGAEYDLESRYMSRLAREEVKEDQNRGQISRNECQKMELQRVVGTPHEDGEPSPDPSIVIDGEEESAVENVPQHESLSVSRADSDLEKSSRTVFLANVSTNAIKSKCAKKALMNHLASFTFSRNGGHIIESFRFRSTAFAAGGIPKKAAYIKKELMDTTTKSTNAYVVYTTQLAARQAVTRLNGSVVLDRHLRVDSVAHPAKVDHRRCVFVGNLGFVDEETSMEAAQGEEMNKRLRKAKEPADAEEGLWRQFGKAGIVESVRIVRDKTTRVGKGFAYVQFKDANSVEKALLYHQKKFPPMLPRVLRVTRAKSMNAANRKDEPFSQNAESIKGRLKAPPQVQSLTGRAYKLLGRAGAAKLKATGWQHKSSSQSVSGVAKALGSVVFEGFRASSSQGKGPPSTAGRKHNRTSNRSKEFKTKGRRKP